MDYAKLYKRLKNRDQEEWRRRSRRRAWKQWKEVFVPYFLLAAVATILVLAWGYVLFHSK